MNILFVEFICIIVYYLFIVKNFLEEPLCSHSAYMIYVWKMDLQLNIWLINWDSLYEPINFMKAENENHL